MVHLRNEELIQDICDEYKRSQRVDSIDDKTHSIHIEPGSIIEYADELYGQSHRRLVVLDIRTACYTNYELMIQVLDLHGKLGQKTFINYNPNKIRVVSEDDFVVYARNCIDKYIALESNNIKTIKETIRREKKLRTTVKETLVESLNECKKFSEHIRSLPIINL